MKVKTFIMFQTIYILNECCSFERSIYQRILLIYQGGGGGGASHQHATEHIFRGIDETLCIRKLCVSGAAGYLHLENRLDQQHVRMWRGF